jgi:SAM-dependent methyltransferase
VSGFSGTYDALADRYDEWAGAIVPDLREGWALKADQHLVPDDQVAELGCGTGRPVGRLLTSRYRYTGVDTSPGMLAEFREAIPDVDLALMDMHRIVFAPGSLGGVVSFYAISHTPREKHGALFERIAGWLRPGGVFIGNLHSRDDPAGFDADWLGAGPMRWSGFDEATNRELLVAAGFTILEHGVFDQVEREGTRICPMWFVAQRP